MSQLRPRPAVVDVRPALTIRAAGAALAALTLVCIATPAEPREASARPVLADGWSVYTPPGKRAATFERRDDGVIEVRTRDAVSFLYRNITATERSALRLAWRWRVDRAIPPTDLGRAGMDDRPLAVHVWFPEPAGRRSMWESLKGALGIPVIGHAITYVWGGRDEPRTVLPNPHLEDAVLVVLRGGDSETGTWFTEEVDPVRDFERAFGRPPDSPPHVIAISSDTDDKGGTVRARIAGLRLLAPAAAR